MPELKVCFWFGFCFLIASVFLMGVLVWCACGGHVFCVRCLAACGWLGVLCFLFFSFLWACFESSVRFFVEGLILAQDERWRRA